MHLHFNCTPLSAVCFLAVALGDFFCAGWHETLKRKFSCSCSVRHTSSQLLSTAEVADTCVLLHSFSVLAWMSSYCEDLATLVINATYPVPAWSYTSLEQCWRTLSSSFWSACPRSTALPLSNKSVKQPVRWHQERPNAHVQREKEREQVGVSSGEKKK